MIDNIYFTSNNIDEEIQDTEEEFERFLSLLEAPNNIDVIGGEWDIYIILFALLKKLEILSNNFKKQVVNSNNIKIFNNYVNDFHQEIVIRLKTDIKTQIINVYSDYLKNKKMLLEIHEFEDFLNHRDTIELFLLGCKKYFDCNEIIAYIEDIDKSMKPFILKTVIPTLILEYGEDICNDFIVSNIKESFWWRKKEIYCF
jgi:hypothetical protein